MRFIFVTMLAWSCLLSAAHAQNLEKCKNLNMSDSSSIKTCLEDDQWYEARTKAQFDPNQKCASMQMIVVKQATMAIDPQAGKRINSKTLDDPSIERPSCETLSEVVELIHNRPASWQPCLGYDAAADKFEHFKTCLPLYQQLRYNAPNRPLGKMDCTRATATYQQALGYIYPPRDDQGEYYGRAVPKTYETPDCEKVNAFVAEENAMDMAERQKHYDEQMVIKAKKKAEAEQKAKEQAEKAKRTQELYAKLEEGYQLAFEDMNKPALNSFKNQEHEQGKIENSQIRHALIMEIWDIMPEKTKDIGSTKAKLIHTTSGFKTWTNTQIAPNVYHAVKDVTIDNCNVKKDKAHCVYDVTVSSSVDFPGIQNDQQRNVYNALGNMAGGGPRKVSLESDFHHDGKQWKADLTYDQVKQLLPPEVQNDLNKAAKDREKMECDMMSAMGVPMLC